MSVVQSKDKDGYFYKSEDGEKFYYIVNNKDSRTTAKEKAKESKVGIFEMNNYVELSSEQVANRRNIKWVVHEINVENLNGCNFKEPYVSNNIESAKNMSLYATFLDSNEDNMDKKVYSNHGESENVDGTGLIFPNTDIVGHATNAYICDLEFDGIIGKYLVAEGFIQSDKFPAFAQELQDELESGFTPKTSVEIFAKKDADGIIYEFGKWTATNRTPTLYDYSGSCFVLTPSDNKAVLLEINSLNKLNSKINILKELNSSDAEDLINDYSDKKEGNKDMTKNKRTIKGQTFEMNALNYYDICSIITRAFNRLMCPTCSDWCYDYDIMKFYPTELYVIMQCYGQSGEYWKVPYTITNGEITLGDIIEVEEDWKPTNEVEETMVDLSSLKEDFINKSKKEMNECEGGNNNMENEKMMTEINAKLEALTAKVGESDAKIAELNSAIVEANKVIEAKTSENANILADKTKAETELNSLKTLKAEEDAKIAQKLVEAEVNSYFETEIKKNGFSEVELNSLKSDFVDKCDLSGLKTKEMELCVKKIKELNSVTKTIEKTVEVNSNTNEDLFVAIQNEEKATDDNSDLY